jgi:hypothetical protein
MTKNFLEWVQEMLVPSLSLVFLVVFEDAPYCSVQIYEPPTLALRKGDVQE